MVDFDYLNRLTREYNHRNVSHNNLYSARDDLNRRNMETYKTNNGQYPYNPYK